MMHRVPGRQILGLPVWSMMPHQCALPSVAGCATRKSRETVIHFAIDQETDDLATFLLRLDEFLRRVTVFLGAAGNADPVLELAIVHAPFVDMGAHATAIASKSDKACNPQSNHGDLHSPAVGLERDYRRGASDQIRVRLLCEA